MKTTIEYANSREKIMIDVTRLHPQWKALHLNYIRTMRAALRDDYIKFSGCKRMIKDAQREMAATRQAVNAARNSATALA